MSCTILDSPFVQMKTECDVELFKKINHNATQPHPNLDHCIKYLQALELVIGLPLTQCQVLMLQKLTANILQNAAFTLHNMYKNTGLNKQMYIVDRMACYMLKFAAKFGFFSDMMYIAMYYYKALRYRDALSITEIIKVKLAQPGLMYRTHVDPERYTEAVGDSPGLPR